jgi:cytidyltransferase-like protein
MSVKAILSHGVCLQDRYIPDYKELADAIKVLREGGHSISMTQGVYDMIHPGHTRYLAKAKSFGDILVVAVDSDEYTRMRKQRNNERRPVIPMEERLELLANVRSVDILTIRDVDHHVAPTKVIEVVRPDVLVMSRSTKDVDEEWHEKLRNLCSAWEGRMELLDPQAVVTSTSRLRELLIDGAGELGDELVATIQKYFERMGRSFTVGGNGGGKHD